MKCYLGLTDCMHPEEMFEYLQSRDDLTLPLIFSSDDVLSSDEVVPSEAKSYCMETDCERYREHMKTEMIIAFRSGCIANRIVNVAVLDDLRRRAWGKPEAKALSE